jgi:NADPH:quinone reductase-like Zn-dependent oxidoreductase
LCKEIGADDVIDYRTTDVVETLSKTETPFDFVLDNIGYNSALYWKSPNFTKPGAKYVQIGAASTLGAMLDLTRRFLVPTALGGGKRPFAFGMTKTVFEDFTQLGQWMKEGKLKPVIDEVFKFEDAPDAYRKLKTGRAKGKIVVRVRGSDK